MSQAGAANITAPGGTATTANPGESTGEAARQALEVLRLEWGHLYLIGYDDDHGWHAARRGRIGRYLAENSPDELRAAMAGDYGPVTS